MKKIIALILSVFGLVAFTSCGEKSNSMTYEEYKNAEVDSIVTIESYIQAKQSWWEDEGVGRASFYLQDEVGAYFVYNLACTEEDYANLTAGTKIQVTGVKGEWAGEVEIMGDSAGNEATYKVLKADKYIASATDVTNLVNNDNLIDYQNKLVAFKGFTVVAQDEEGTAVYYKWDNSGSVGDDLYVNLEKDGVKLTIVVESYLCDKDSQVYKQVESLTVGQTLDLEGFLYWYEGPQPHITKVTISK